VDEALGAGAGVICRVADGNLASSVFFTLSV